YPVPFRLIDRPLKVATPLEALTVAVPFRVPPPGLVPIATATDAELPVMIFPPASCTVTTGWVPNAVAYLDLLGLVVKATFAAAPTLTVIDGLVFAVFVPSVTSEPVTVAVPAVFSVTLNVPAPATSAALAGSVAFPSDDVMPTVLVELIAFQFASTA